MFPIIPDDTIDLLKIKETGVPMMAISGKSWVGEVGEFAYSQIASRYNSIIFAHTCFGYDAAYLIGIALDYMINQGYDYTDPYKINSAIRSQKFTGCTGVVSIDKGSNDRAMDTFDIMATKIDTNSGNIVAYKMGEFRPFGGTMLSIKTPFIYGGGTTVKPDDLRNQNNKCPFHENLIRGFAKGRIIVFSICFMFALVSFAATAYIWKKWWNITIEELKEKQEMSLQDIIVMITIGIEFFQFAAMGPDIAPINSFLAKISSSLSLSHILKWLLLSTCIRMDRIYLLFCGYWKAPVASTGCASLPWFVLGCLPPPSKGELLATWGSCQTASEVDG